MSAATAPEDESVRGLRGPLHKYWDRERTFYLVRTVLTTEQRELLRTLMEELRTTQEMRSRIGKSVAAQSPTGSAS